MSITFNDSSILMESTMGGKLVHGIVTGKLEKEDYELIVPEMEKQIVAHKPIRLFLELRDFEGWSASAFWEECKLGYKHLGDDVERIAVVGDQKWEEGLTNFVKPFTSTEIRYFDATEREAAENWITENLRQAA
jgi:hypothetical protein